MSNSKILLLICIATMNTYGMYKNSSIQKNNFPTFVKVTPVKPVLPSFVNSSFFPGTDTNPQSNFPTIKPDVDRLNSVDLPDLREQPKQPPTSSNSLNTDSKSPTTSQGNSRRSSLKRSSSMEKLIENNSKNSSFKVLCSKIDLLATRLENLESKMEKSLQNHGKNGGELEQAKELFRKIQEMNTNYENKFKESKLQEELQQEKIKYGKDLDDLRKTNIKNTKRFEIILNELDKGFSQKEIEYGEISDQQKREIEQKTEEIAGYKRQLEEQKRTLEQGPPWYKQPHTTFIFGALTCHFISNPQLYLWAFLKTTSFVLRGIANLAPKKEATSA